MVSGLFTSKAKKQERQAQQRKYEEEQAAQKRDREQLVRLYHDQQKRVNQLEQKVAAQGTAKSQQSHLDDRRSVRDKAVINEHEQPSTIDSSGGFYESESNENGSHATQRRVVVNSRTSSAHTSREMGSSPAIRKPLTSNHGSLQTGKTAASDLFGGHPLPSIPHDTDTQDENSDLGSAVMNDESSTSSPMTPVTSTLSDARLSIVGTGTIEMQSSPMVQRDSPQPTHRLEHTNEGTRDVHEEHEISPTRNDVNEQSKDDQIIQLRTQLVNAGRENQRITLEYDRKVKQYDTLQTKHASTKKDLEVVQERYGASKANHEILQNQFNDAKIKYDQDLKTMKTGYLELSQGHDAELRQLRIQRNADKSEWVKQREQHESEMREREKTDNAMRKKWAQDLSEQKSFHETQLIERLTEAKTGYEATLGDITKEHKSQFEEVQQKWRSEVKKYTSSKKSLEEQVQREKEQRIRELQTMSDRHNTDRVAQETKHEKLLKGLTRKHQTKEQEQQRLHEEQTVKMRSEWQVERQTLAAQLSAAEKEHLEQQEKLIRESRDTKSTLERQLADALSTHTADRAALMKHYDREITSTHQRYKGEIADRDQVKQNEITLLSQKHQDEVVHMQQQYEAEMKKLFKKHNGEKSALKLELTTCQQKYAAETTRQQQEHENSIAKLKTDYEDKLAKLRSEVATRQQQHGIDMANLKKEYEAFCETLESKHKSTTQQMEKAYADRTASMKADIEAYSATLMARDEKAASIVRDDFKQIPDEEINSKFSDLVRVVDGVARLEWKSSQDIDPRVLSRNQSQRECKKQILQDSIWTILFEYVFSSPFRIFGDEGKALEKEWNDEYGQDYILTKGGYRWPKPGMQSERWRYITVKECRVVLMNAVPSKWDPRAKLKKGFVDTLTALKNELTETFSSVAEVSDGTKKSIDVIARKAAMMWLEYGMQRPRILVILQGSQIKSVAKKIEMAQEGGVRLDVVPKLVKYGNAKGFELGVQTVVGKNQGEVSKLP